MAGQPEVITGARGPRNEVRERSARRSPGLAGIPEGKTVFRFSHARYRLQLTAPEEVKRSDGTVYRAKALVVMADNFKTTLDNLKDAETIERIRKHEAFGVDIFDMADDFRAVKERQTQAAIDLLADPEAKAAIIAALKASGEEDFALPGEKRARGTKPAAAQPAE